MSRKPPRTPTTRFSFLLLLSVALLQGCGGSGGDSVDNTVMSPATPAMDGITGRVASRMSGGLISVTDAGGEEVVVASGRTTDSNGAFSLVFSEFAINAGINPPLLITVDGSNATAICDYNGDGDNDCLTRDGSFAAYGETYDLPEGFTLRGIAPDFPDETTEGDRVVNVNLTAASDIAARYALTAASGNPLDLPGTELAARQALGLVEFITGLSTAGSKINEIPVIDLTTAANPVTSALAISLFGASLHGLVDTSVSSQSSYRRMLDRVGGRVTASPALPENQLGSDSTFLAGMMTPYLNIASTYQASLETPSPVIAGAIAAQLIAIPRLETLGASRTAIALPAVPDSDDALERSRTFSSRLSEAMGATLLVSSSASFAGTAAGAETVYADQLTLMNTLVSEEVRRTLLQLDSAIAEAEQQGISELTGTNVSGALTFDGDTVSMTSATSTFSNIQTGISVNISIAAGTRTNPGDSGIFTAGDITIAVTQTLNDVTTQQLFNGELALDLQAGTGGVDISVINYAGDLRAASALEFEGEITVTSPSPLGAASTSGSYNATFVFPGSTTTLSGDLASQVERYSVSAGVSSIVADLITREVTDMNATLNLGVDADDQFTGGTLTASGETTGSLATDGILTFSDGTAVALPIPII